MDTLGWEVAPDGGRPEGRSCTHLALLSAPPAPPEPPAPPTAGCADCLPRGWRWVRLRLCVTCGNVGCCDSSRGTHAHDHYVRSGHPVVLSLASDEGWAWCFADQVFLIRSRAGA
ncbi:UBP-type zinc finger domain-containing protein [Streptomyces sp. NPDC056503]|uniref:UBP-type zinc finger domain-containing protein n=1 Tax=Streptomyces sp. NPDC056503 TaxID=3345842 RepID=UPI00369AD7BA